MTRLGADYTFECVGSVKLMRIALESAAKGWGLSVILGLVRCGLERNLITSVGLQCCGAGTRDSYAALSVNYWTVRTDEPPLR